MSKQSLLDQAPQAEIAVVAQLSPLALFERLATDPNASVEKIERLMALWERGEARKAETEFYAQMAEAQKGMKPVREDATNPQTRSKYASYEALDRVLRPIYTDHGFGLSFDTEDSPVQEHVRVVCLVAHVAGHCRKYRIDMPADGKGAKGGDVMTKTHATGSAVSYGMRYLLKMIWNVATGEGDDDGNRAGKRQDVPTPPKGYDDWIDNLTATAERKGMPALQEEWGKSPAEFRKYLNAHHSAFWADLKEKARKVQA